jgi:hypothetical protein
VTKCEIFNRLDFYDFYTIKSFKVGDFGAEIKFFIMFSGSFRGTKFLTRMLSLIFKDKFFLSLGQKFLGFDFETVC